MAAVVEVGVLTYHPEQGVDAEDEPWLVGNTRVAVLEVAADVLLVGFGDATPMLVAEVAELSRGVTETLGEVETKSSEPTADNSSLVDDVGAVLCIVGRGERLLDLGAHCHLGYDKRLVDWEDTDHRPQHRNTAGAAIVLDDRSALCAVLFLGVRLWNASDNSVEEIQRVV
jgi:hypothetical protein